MLARAPATPNRNLQSRYNAMRHGPAAATVVTAIEDVEEFKLFKPRTELTISLVKIEHELTARLASLLWWFRRTTIKSNC